MGERKWRQVRAHIAAGVLAGWLVDSAYVSLIARKRERAVESVVQTMTVLDKASAPGLHACTARGAWVVRIDRSPYVFAQMRAQMGPSEVVGISDDGHRRSRYHGWPLDGLLPWLDVSHHMDVRRFSARILAVVYDDDSLGSRHVASAALIDQGRVICAESIRTQSSYVVDWPVPNPVTALQVFAARREAWLRGEVVLPEDTRSPP